MSLRFGLRVFCYYWAMSNLFLIAITGPTGSGKSSTAQLLAEQVDSCVNIDVDLVKHFIVSGFRYEEATGVDQWELLGKNLGMLAANFHRENYNVIVNGYLREQAWMEIEKYVTFTHTFLLLPALETTKERNSGRDLKDQMDENSVLQHYAFFSNHKYYKNFTMIDSSNQSVNQTVEYIKSKL